MLFLEGRVENRGGRGLKMEGGGGEKVEGEVGGGRFLSEKWQSYFFKKDQNSSFLNVNGPFFFREWTVFIERSVLL